MDYKFYGWENADVSPADNNYAKIKDPKMLYDMLSEIWCAETCAPRLRDRWTEENRTLGHIRRKGVRDTSSRRKLSLL